MLAGSARSDLALKVCGKMRVRVLLLIIESGRWPPIPKGLNRLVVSRYCSRPFLIDKAQRTTSCQLNNTRRWYAWTEGWFGRDSARTGKQRAALPIQAAALNQREAPPRTGFPGTGLRVGRTFELLMNDHAGEAQLGFVQGHFLCGQKNV